MNKVMEKKRTQIEHTYILSQFCKVFEKIMN